MYLFPHVNHVCDTDATAVYSFLTCYTIPYFQDTTAILVDYPQWDKCTLKLYKANEISSFLGYECEVLLYQDKISLSFTMKFPHHLPNYSHKNGGHNKEVNETS